MRTPGTDRELEAPATLTALLLAPGAGGEAGLFAEPAGEVVGVVEAGFGGGAADVGQLAEGGLGGLQTFLVAQAPKTEAVLAFEAPGERVADVTGFAGDVGERLFGAKAFADANHERGRLGERRGIFGARGLEEPGDHRKNGGVVGKRKATLGGNAGEQRVKFVESLLRKVAVEDSRAAAPFVIKGEAERSARARHGEAVIDAGRQDKEIARPGLDAALANDLNPLAREVEDKLMVGVVMRSDLGLPMAVQLQFAQHKT